MSEQIQNEPIPHKKIKLAEGLLLRADLLKKIEHLQNRIKPVLIVSDDKLPQEDPEKLLAQLRKTIQDLESIIVRINKTNNETHVEGEGFLMEALAKRDALKMLSERLRNIRQAAQIYNNGILLKQRLILKTCKLKWIEQEEHLERSIVKFKKSIGSLN